MLSANPPDEADSDEAGCGARYRRSPTTTSHDRNLPAASSTTACAEGDHAIRQGARSLTIFSARPSRSTNTTSMAKRMTAV